MDDFRQAVGGVLATLNPVLMLCISGGVALVFIGALAIDSFVRRNKRRNSSRSGRSHGNAVTSKFRNVRSAWRSVFEELDRRKRRIDREQGRRR